MFSDPLNPVFFVDSICVGGSPLNQRAYFWSTTDPPLTLDADSSAQVNQSDSMTLEMVLLEKSVIGHDFMVLVYNGYKISSENLVFYSRYGCDANHLKFRQNV